MKILVVSGFLGTGKTTFIKTLSNKIDKKIAVLENDYAAVNIDEDILKNQTDLSVWEQTEKCICCTGKSDFAMDILTISNTLNPDFLIVEPTGVGYLSKVVANIQKNKRTESHCEYYPDPLRISGRGILAGTFQKKS